MNSWKGRHHRLWGLGSAQCVEEGLCGLHLRILLCDGHREDADFGLVKRVESQSKISNPFRTSFLVQVRT
jgi:hypothetical protein